jgi:hypothetical protein
VHGCCRAGEELYKAGAGLILAGARLVHAGAAGTHWCRTVVGLVQGCCMAGAGLL